MLSWQMVGDDLGNGRVLPVHRDRPGRDDDDVLRTAARMVSLASSTPQAAATQYDYILRSIDVRRALPQIQAPTPVLHVRDPVQPSIEHGHYLADHIPGASP